MLLLLHQALPGPSTKSTALNRVKFKMVFCLGFKVPLHIFQYGQKTLAQNYFSSSPTIIFHLLLFRFCPSFYPSLESCLPFSIAVCFGLFFSPFPLVTNLVVLTVTMMLSGVLHVHLHVGRCLICWPSCQEWEISHVGGCPRNRCF